MVAVLEKHLLDIETVSAARDYDGVAMKIHNDLSTHTRNDIAGGIASLRERLTEFSRRFSLDSRTDSVSRAVAGKLHICWEMLESSRGRHLTAYGEVEEDTKSDLNVHVNGLITLLSKLEQSLRQ